VRRTYPKVYVEVALATHYFLTLHNSIGVQTKSYYFVCDRDCNFGSGCDRVRPEKAIRLYPGRGMCWELRTLVTVNGLIYNEM
jgi:hypothetical protein